MLVLSQDLACASERSVVIVSSGRMDWSPFHGFFDLGSGGDHAVYPAWAKGAANGPSLRHILHARSHRPSVGRLLETACSCYF